MILRCTLFIIIASSLFIHNVWGSSEKLRVVTSFYPLAHFAEQVGGDNIEAINVMPPGADPHEFEPTPRDIARIYGSGIFLYHGAGIDSWAERIDADLTEKGILTIHMTERFSLSGREEEEDHGDHHHGEQDPHIWLDPLLAVKEVEIIRDALIRADPMHKESYIKNSTAYIEQLQGLHDRYTSGLKTCKKREIIVSHDAFSYLAERYDLRAHAIAGMTPEEEPSPRRMVELSKFAVKENIKYIFFEKLVSPKLSKTIADEVGAKTLVLDPIGGVTKKEAGEGKTYITLMEKNLQNLRIAMECE